MEYAGRTPTYARTDDPSTDFDESNPYDPHALASNHQDESLLDRLLNGDNQQILLLAGVALVAVVALSRGD